MLHQTFEKISSDLGISHGAAVEIEKQWKIDLGSYDANAILDLAKVMKKLDMAPAECAEGLQIGVILREFGIKPEGVKKFLSVLGEELIARGIPANEAVDSMAQMAELAQRFGAQPEKVPDLLENALKNLGETQAKISDAFNQFEEVQKRLKSALDEMHTTRENIGKCVEVENKLKELGLSLSKIDDVINVVRNVEGLGQDPAKVAAAFASIDSLMKQRDALESEIKSAKGDVYKTTELTKKLQNELSSLEGLKKSLDTFVAEGFNQELLEELLKIVKDVAVQRSIPVHLAAGQFLVEVESDYNAILGFKRTLAMLQEELAKINKALAKEQTAFAEYKDAIESCTFLNKKGVQGKDLIYWHKVLEEHPKLSAEMLTECLRDYGDLKEAVISLEKTRKDLESKLHALNIDIEALQKEKIRATEDLENTRKTTSEELQQHKIKLEELKMQERELLQKMAMDVIQETTKKALLAGLTLRATNSPLLPIITSENGGPPPKVEELVIAGIHVLTLLERTAGPSDPLTSSLPPVIAVLWKRLGGRGSGGSSTAAVPSSTGAK
jgi:DNA repair exonuclease SbcCD ATPase subunit